MEKRETAVCKQTSNRLTERPATQEWIGRGWGGNRQLLNGGKEANFGKSNLDSRTQKNHRIEPCQILSTPKGFEAPFLPNNTLL